jgi:hypothetical protein
VSRKPSVPRDAGVPARESCANWRIHFGVRLPSLAEEQKDVDLFSSGVTAQIAPAGGTRCRSRSHALWRYARPLAKGGVADERVRALFLAKPGLRQLRRCSNSSAGSGHCAVWRDR